MHMIDAQEDALPDSVRNFFGGGGEEKSSAQSPGTESAEAATQVFAESMETMAQALARRIASEYQEGKDPKIWIELLQSFARSIDAAATGAENIPRELLEVAIKGFIALTTPGVGDKAAAQAMVTALTKRYGDLSE